MRKGVALMALALLAVAGCASPDPEPVSVEPAAVEIWETGPCGIRELVPSCTAKLADIALAGSAAFDALASPTLEQVEADIAIDHGSQTWAEDCRQWETYAVGDVFLVVGCQGALEKIAGGAELLGVS